MVLIALQNTMTGYVTVILEVSFLSVKSVNCFNQYLHQLYFRALWQVMLWICQQLKFLSIELVTCSFVLMSVVSQS